MVKLDKAGGKARSKLSALIVAAFAASAPFADPVPTDVYGNEIVEVDGSTYQFWSGTKAEIAARENVSEAISAGGGLHAIFNSVLESAGGSVSTLPPGVMFIIW